MAYDLTATSGPDWDRLAFKYQQVYGLLPPSDADTGKLLRKIREVDPQWAAAADEFIDVFGTAPAGTADTRTVIRQVDARTVEFGDVGEAPVTTQTGTVIPEGGRLIVVRNPAGSDAARLYYYALPWRGIEVIYEIGDEARFVELFGPRVESTFLNVNVWSQAQFDSQDQFVMGGTIDQKLGQTESEASLIEREIRAAGLEDIPAWIADSQDALVLVATGTGQEWSSGRLWTELAKTTAFDSRYGDVIEAYRAGGQVTIADAVAQIERDEQAMIAALRPFTADQAPPDIEYVHGLLNEGWTPGFVAQVLEQRETLERDPDSLATSNLILEASGLPPLDEVGFINALNGYGPQDVVEALNTATAARALDEAGIDLADDDLELIMELVDQSDRLVTADSWRQLSQQLSLNLIQFNREIDQERLGLVRDDLIAAAFGQESPTGKSSGEVLALVARLERDRRAAGEGIPGRSAFQDAEGNLRLQGIGSL